MSKGTLGIDQKSFLDRFGFTSQEFDQAGIGWKILESIRQSHTQSRAGLEATGEHIVNLLSSLPDVHSLKLRVKDPEHLIAKIIRKRLDRPEIDITVDNYRDHITDLIGIRALHLFKDQWHPIHEFVKSTWDLHETPIAYIREGDPEALRKRFADCDCDVRNHPKGYRSVHYLILSQPTKGVHVAELQVRTLLEEAWSEIDHLVRYPRLSDNHYLVEFLNIFNRLAGSADEMGTFIKGLSIFIGEQAKMESELKTKEEELRKAISLLKISNEEKKKLEAQVSELRRSSKRGSFVAGGREYFPNYFPDLTAPMSGVTLQAPSAGWLTAHDTLTYNIFERTCARCGRNYQDDTVSLTIGAIDYCPECRLQLVSVTALY